MSQRPTPEDVKISLESAFNIKIPEWGQSVAFAKISKNLTIILLKTKLETSQNYLKVFYYPIYLNKNSFPVLEIPVSKLNIQMNICWPEKPDSVHYSSQRGKIIFDYCHDPGHPADSSSRRYEISLPSFVVKTEVRSGVEGSPDLQLPLLGNDFTPFEMNSLIFPYGVANSTETLKKALENL